MFSKRNTKNCREKLRDLRKKVDILLDFRGRIAGRKLLEESRGVARRFNGKKLELKGWEKVIERVQRKIAETDTIDEL